MTQRVEIISNKTIATKGDDGIWEVISDIVMGLKLQDETEFDTRSMAVKAYDKDVMNAIRVAHQAIQKKFEDLQFNLFQIPKEEDGPYIANPLENNKTIPVATGDKAV